MAHFVRSSGDGREGLAIHFVAGQPHGLRFRVVVIAQVRTFYLDGVEAIAVKKLPRQLAA